ncbi:MAG TPA: hypothetical protein VGE45_01075 [Chloroflexia bacterium]|jgi:hypothetical protein
MFDTLVEETRARESAELLLNYGDRLNYIAFGEWENLCAEARGYLEKAVTCAKEGNTDNMVIYLDAALGAEMLKRFMYYDPTQVEKWHQTGSNTVIGRTKHPR